MRCSVTALVVSLLVGMVAGGVADAQSPSPEQPEAGVRVYVPEAGVALTIPFGWSVTVNYRRVDPAPGESMPADERWHVLSTMADASELDGCRLLRYQTSGSTLDEFAAELLGGQPLAVTPIRIDVGEVVRLDLELGGPETAQQYVFGSEETFYQLACIRGEGPPDDYWLSIAESFEFLPEVTPLYAPDDLESLLPESLNGMPLASMAGRGDGLVAEGLEDPSYLEDVLTPLGKDPTDYHKAIAATGDPTYEDIEWTLAPEGYWIRAMRVDGIPGDVLWDRMMRVGRDLDDDEALPEPFKAPRTLLGRTYLWMNNADGAAGERWVVQYAKGEVLFMVNGWGGLTAEDVLAELP